MPGKDETSQAHEKDKWSKSALDAYEKEDGTKTVRLANSEKSNLRPEGTAGVTWLLPFLSFSALVGLPVRRASSSSAGLSVYYSADSSAGKTSRTLPPHKWPSTE